jgi:hypothetical protein
MALGHGLFALHIVSMRVLARPGWYIFKNLEDEPRAIGIVDGPFATFDEADREAAAMIRRRRLLDVGT